MYLIDVLIRPFKSLFLTNGNFPWLSSKKGTLILFAARYFAVLRGTSWYFTELRGTSRCFVVRYFTLLCATFKKYLHACTFIWYLITWWPKVISFIGGLVHVSSVSLFLSMNNFLADGWLVGDSKQQAFSWFSLRCQSWITCTVLNSAQRLMWLAVAFFLIVCWLFSPPQW